MKKLFTLILLGAALGAGAQSMGINTADPKATLDVVGSPATATELDGIIPPKLTRAQLIAKAGYGVAQKGAIVYVTDLTGTVNTATANVGQTGLYMFDGSKWNIVAQKFAGFSAYRTESLTLVEGAVVDILFPFEIYDTNNWYNGTTGEFKPTVAGYYQINAAARLFSADPYVSTERSIIVYKNNESIGKGTSIIGNTVISALSLMVYLNGVNDTIKIKAYSATRLTSASAKDQTYFQGYLIGQ